MNSRAIHTLACLMAVAITAFGATPAPPAPVTFTASSSALQFNYASTATALPVAQAVQLKATAAAIPYTVSVPASANWLIVTPPSGVMPAALSFRVNPTSLQAGTYNALVSITGTGATNGPLTVKVTLVVKGTPPVLTAAPSPVQFDFSTGASGATPATIPLSLTSSGQSASVALAASGAPWLKLSKTAGFTIAGAPLVVDLSVDTAVAATLVPKTYQGSIVVTPNDASIKAINIPVKLVITAGLPVLTKIWPGDVPVGSESITLTLIGSNFLNTTTVTFGATPATTVGLVSSNVLMATVPTSVLTTPGTYAVSAKNGILESAQLNFTVGALGPYIAGITNAASFFAADTISPGEMISIFGSAFGVTEVTPGVVTGGVLGTQIADTEVQFEVAGAWTAKAPLVFASEGQINAITPFGLPAGATKLRVATAVSTTPVYSSELPLTVVPANPGVFTADSSGIGQGAILNAVPDTVDPAVTIYSLNSVKNPAVKGSTVVLYLTGGGALVGGGTDGLTVTGTPPRTVTTPVVTINGVDVVADYSGAVPGSVQGLVQVNFKIPADMTVSSAHPLTVTYGGRASQAGVTLAVK